MFKIIQEEINLLVKQAQIVSKSEEIHKQLISLGETYRADILRDELNKIYPSYLELLAKYTANN
jgi:hypothetical protein